MQGDVLCHRDIKLVMVNVPGGLECSAAHLDISVKQEWRLRI
jgi:hypothetical protein